MKAARAIGSAAFCLGALACTPSHSSSQSGSSDATAVKGASPAAVTSNKNSAGGSDASACLSLVNGEATTAYPAVVRLMQAKGSSVDICTGTFISPTAVITAAHCINSTSNGGVYLIPGTSVSFGGDPLLSGVAALRAFTLGATGSGLNAQDPAAVGKDTAILLFPPGLSQAVATIGAARPTAGSVITTVGYGLTSYMDAPQDPNYDASKHAGTTQVLAETDGVNLYTGEYTAAESAAGAGSEVVNSFGDSGGPMLYNGSLVATLSNGGDGPNSAGTEAYFSVFVDINSANTKQLIAVANAAGAAIPAGGAPLSQTVPTSSSGPTPSTNNNAASCTN